MKDNNCIFCKLANGDIPTNSIYEDNDFKVILDASPATKGHALILPKNHFANLFEIDDEVAAKALPLARKIANKMMKELGYCSGIENYSRYFDGRKPGTRPFCILDYFPDDFIAVSKYSRIFAPRFERDTYFLLNLSAELEPRKRMKSKLIIVEAVL